MSDVENRLVRCFASIFPNLPPEQLRAASIETVPAWDSLASVTLVAVIEQEFATQIDLMDMSELSSFDAVRSYLHKQNVIS